MIKIEEEIPVYSINDVTQSPEGRVDYKLKRLEYFSADTSHLTIPHRYDHYSLFYIAEGTGTFIIDMRSVELKPNRLFFISPGQVHLWKNVEQLSGFSLSFTADFFDIALQYSELRDFLFYNTQQQNSYLDLNEERARYFNDLFEKIEMEQEQPANYSLNIIRSCLNVLLFQVTRIYEKVISADTIKSGVDSRLIEFEKLLQQHFKTLKTVAGYADLIFVTPNYLNTICKKEKGKSAGELIRDRVMLEAKRMLSHSDLSISEIAHELNFDDNSYFGRFFKKYSGQTPASFRLQVKSFNMLHPLKE